MDSTIKNLIYALLINFYSIFLFIYVLHNDFKLIFLSSTIVMILWCYFENVDTRHRKRSVKVKKI
jgi:hypothetical protein